MILGNKNVPTAVTGMKRLKTCQRDVTAKSSEYAGAGFTTDVVVHQKAGD